MAFQSAGDVLADTELRIHRRAVRFFWVVLIGASAASIAGNALHAIVQADHIAPALAAAVATAPPLVLLASTEGLSLLIKVHRRSTPTFWLVLIMTLLLGAGAFRLSFDALCSLAVRCGIRPSLAWLWPLIIDVTTAQATVALVVLARLLHSRPQAAACDEDEQVALPRSEASAGERDSAPRPIEATQSLSSVPRSDSAAPTRERHDRAVRTVMASKRTKQPPEVVDDVLRRYADGQRPGEISEELKLHHTTVNRILATGLHSAAV
jgi:hypothetical protein